MLVRECMYVTMYVTQRCHNNRQRFKSQRGAAFPKEREKVTQCEWGKRGNKKVRVEQASK